MRSGLVIALVSACSLGACAKADEKQLVNLQGDGGTLHPHNDAGSDGSGSDHPTPDAFILPDAPPNVMSKTLTETGNDTIVPANSAKCPDNEDSGGSGESHYYRVFDLASFGITTDFTVSGVTFQVEDSFGLSGDSDGGQLVDVNVGTYTGTVGGNTFALSNLSTPIGSATGIDVPEVDEDRDSPPSTPGATVTTPIAATIPGGSKLYVEIASDDGSEDHYLYMGTTNSETVPGYLYAPNCVNKPTALSTLTQSPARTAALLLTVTGTY